MEHYCGDGTPMRPQHSYRIWRRPFGRHRQKGRGAGENHSIPGMASFEFAWKQPQYCDRILRLHLSVASDTPVRQHKRRRCNPASPTSVTDDPAVDSLDSCPVTEDVPVSSVVLSRDCLFFRRLFDGDRFKESQAEVIDIHLKQEEKVPFLDMLQFMYTGKVEAGNAQGIAAVWLLGERFLVESCVEHCMQRLRCLPPTLEQSSYVLDLASVVDQSDDLKVLVEMSIAFLASYFSSTTVMNAANPGRWDHMDDFRKLPITAVEFLLKSDLLQAVHEEAVFHAVRAWTSANCKGREEKKGAWERLGPLIRWPFIEPRRLKAISGEPEAEHVMHLIVEAFCYKASAEEEQQATIAADPRQQHRFRRRVKHALAVQFLSVDLPVKQAIVCFTLPLDAWNRMATGLSPVCTERFFVAGYSFLWLLQPAGNRHRVCIGLVALTKPPNPFSVTFSVSVWDRRVDNFVLKFRGIHTVGKQEVEERVAMCLDCFGTDMAHMMDEKNGFLISDATCFHTEVQLLDINITKQ